MPVPVVEFTDERLANGLRLIVAEDHLAPVVAVNLWYDVGSKHEVAGKTGFAHLFEHVMFQGTAHVGKAEHMALVQAAGGTLNGTTWLDRTNYFETLPSHQLELALWLEADRMGTLLDALSQENLDNQREVVKNEKRWSYDNRPYGSWNEKILAPPVPGRAPVPPPDDRLDGGPRRRLARRRQGVLPHLLRAQQRGAVGRGRLRPGAGARVGATATSAPIPANPSIPPLRRPVAAARCSASEIRETVEDNGAAAADLLRVPRARVRRHAARRARPRRPAAHAAARAAGSTGASSARSAWPRTSRSSRCRSSAARR